MKTPKNKLKKYCVGFSYSGFVTINVKAENEEEAEEMAREKFENLPAKVFGQNFSDYNIEGIEEEK